MLKDLINVGMLTTALAMTQAAKADHNPLGDVANYKVDTDPARTSSMVDGGTMTATVTEHDAGTDQDGPSYKVQLDYDFDTMMGSQTGTKYQQISDVFFTTKFLTDLRANGHYEDPQFKIDHLGYEDAHTMDGHDYAHCDKVLIYDVKESSDSGMVTIAKQLLLSAVPMPMRSRDEIQDLKIHADIYQGVPVLGAVKLDVSGVYQGMDVKAGGDYEAP